MISRFETVLIFLIVQLNGTKVKFEWTQFEPWEIYLKDSMVKLRTLTNTEGLRGEEYKKYNYRFCVEYSTFYMDSLYGHPVFCITKEYERANLCPTDDSNRSPIDFSSPSPKDASICNTKEVNYLLNASTTIDSNNKIETAKVDNQIDLTSEIKINMPIIPLRRTGKVAKCQSSDFISLDKTIFKESTEEKFLLLPKSFEITEPSEKIAVNFNRFEIPNEQLSDSNLK